MILYLIKSFPQFTTEVIKAWSVFVQGMLYVSAYRCDFQWEKSQSTTKQVWSSHSSFDLLQTKVFVSRTRAMVSSSFGAPERCHLIRLMIP